jgi:hypothetical protein
MMRFAYDTADGKKEAILISDFNQTERTVIGSEMNHEKISENIKCAGCLIAAYFTVSP